MVFVAPYTSLDDFTCGSIEAGMPNNSSKSSSHCSVWMLKSIVREALVHVRHVHLAAREAARSASVSTVPNSSLPSSARFLAPATLSRIHLIFVALK